ncbi:MAG: hypothetical protein U9R42_09505 [Bacteroidota bacterium]|nr:hypothetical protein [Bacteroidota bacterium]
MKIRLSIFILLFIFTSSVALSYNNARALLMVNKKAQPDSLDYNIVESFTKLIYSKLKEEKIFLWDSPRKESKINFLTLQNFEKTYNYRFEDLDNFFIYESWSSNSKKSEFKIHGFSFTSETKNGKEINYGYLEFSVVSDYLKSNYLNTSIESNYLNSYFAVFMNKAFNFDILFFKNKPILSANSKHPEKDYRKGLRIRDKAFFSAKKNMNAIEVKTSKLLYFKLITNDYDSAGMLILSAIEDYFDLHRRELIEYGGKSIFNSFRDSPFILTGCKVKEIWIKEEGRVSYKLLEIVPYSFSIDFKPINFVDLIELGINVKGVPLDKCLAIKNFKYHIIKINTAKIDSDLTPSYIEALKNAEWNELKKYIEMN